MFDFQNNGLRSTKQSGRIHSLSTIQDGSKVFISILIFKTPEMYITNL